MLIFDMKRHYRRAYNFKTITVISSAASVSTTEFALSKSLSASSCAGISGSDFSMDSIIQSPSVFDAIPSDTITTISPGAR